MFKLFCMKQLQLFLLKYYIFTFETCHCRVISFVFSEPSKRLSMCIYWMCIICVSVLRFYNISKNSKIERILLRKYYHLMAVLMFLPALIFQVIWTREKGISPDGLPYFQIATLNLQIWMKGLYLSEACNRSFHISEAVHYDFLID